MVGPFVGAISRMWDSNLNYLFRELFVGFALMAIILIFHGACITRIMMRYEIKSRVNLKHSRFNKLFLHFYIAILKLATVHIVEIIFWAFCLVLAGLINNPIQALLFSGSTYTTIGFEGDILPDHWKNMAFLVAFSGMITFAWTTSILISMTPSFRRAWLIKHQKMIAKEMVKHELDLEIFDQEIK